MDRLTSSLRKDLYTWAERVTADDTHAHPDDAVTLAKNIEAQLDDMDNAGRGYYLDHYTWSEIAERLGFSI